MFFTGVAPCSEGQDTCRRGGGRNPRIPVPPRTSRCASLGQRLVIYLGYLKVCESALLHVEVTLVGWA